MKRKDQLSDNVALIMLSKGNSDQNYVKMKEMISSSY